MRGMSIRMFALVVIAMVGVLFIAAPASAQGAAEETYKAKCAACHGADGSGSAVGKKLGTHDFGGAEVQKMSDAELSDIIAGHAPVEFGVLLPFLPRTQPGKASSSGL